MIARVRVNNTMTKTSFTIVTPRTTSASGPDVCVSSITATVRSGEEFADQMPRISATASTPENGSADRNGTSGLINRMIRVTPPQTAPVTASVTYRMFRAWALS